jgi:Protein of unknown function (DUF3396)
VTNSAFNELVDISSVGDFDKLFLSQRAGEKTVLFGFSICLFYEGGSTVARRLDGNKLIADYSTIFGDLITHFYPVGARRRRKIDRIAPVEYYSSAARKSEPEEAYGAALYGFPGGVDVGGASAHYIDNVGTDQFELWSYSNSYLPIRWVEAQGTAEILHILIRWCNLLKPGHGTAGLSLILDEGSAKAPQSRLAFPIIKRFPGIDFPDLGAWSSEVRHEKKRWIRTVSWLTILDDGFVGELGGLEKMRAELGDDCPIHVWNGGVIIQAGPEPEVGDVNQGLIPEAYRKVARLTKPLRFENLKGRISLLNPPPPLDYIEESLKWIRRFD